MNVDTQLAIQCPVLGETAKMLPRVAFMLQTKIRY